MPESKANGEGSLAMPWLFERHTFRIDNQTTCHSNIDSIGRYWNAGNRQHANGRTFPRKYDAQSACTPRAAELIRLRARGASWRYQGLFKPAS